jgi:hypothetical protein
MKTIVWLLTAWNCGGLGSACPRHFEIYDTQPACEIALAKWTNSGGWWFASGIRNGMCFPRYDLTENDIELYRNFKP